MPTKNSSLIHYLVLLLSASALFGIIYFTNKWFFISLNFLQARSWLPETVRSFFVESSPQHLVNELFSPIRGIVFITSFFVLVTLLVRDIDWSRLKGMIFPDWRMVFTVFFVLCVLVLPSDIIRMADEYERTSVVLFSKISEIQYSERFLFTALAHTLYFRGGIFFLVFSLLLSIVFIYLLVFWFVNNGINLSWWELLSLCLMTFVSYKFYSPGYPDVLMHIFLLLALVLPLSSVGWLVLFVLSMATHEANIFIWTVLALFFLPKANWAHYTIIAALYVIIRFAGSGFDGIFTFTPRVVNDVTTFDALLNNFHLEITGVFFGFGAGWIMIIMALYGLYKDEKFREVGLISILISVGILMTVLGSDTARLMGWAFPALLFSWRFLAFDTNTLRVRIFQFAKVINLFIPPLYVGLDGIEMPNGFYKLLFGKLFS